MNLGQSDDCDDLSRYFVGSDFSYVCRQVGPVQM